MAERILKYPAQYRQWYDQGKSGGCLGFSLSIFASILNPGWRFDAEWLYAWAQINDNNIYTNPRTPWTGTFIWAGFEGLRRVGHVDYKYSRLPFKKKTAAAELRAGVANYWWISSVDEIRAAIATEGKPVDQGIIV